jgi:GH15 family glucan-1,4-alpha-glucosidase
MWDAVMAARIEDYALIGDCETAALIGRDGSLDWLCWPRFDSPACFAALLGGPEHGRWKIAPLAHEVTTSRAYRADTLILETRFETADGTALLIDFMPLRGSNSDVIRRVTGLHGRVLMRNELTIRTDYGRTVPWVTRMESGCLRAIAGPHMLVLQTDAALHGEAMSTVGDFVVGAGETVARMGQTVQHKRTMAGAGGSIPDHPQGADLPANGRHRSRRNDFAARVHRRRAQLGLPLLLASRHYFYSTRADGRRLLRGGARVA